MIFDKDPASTAFKVVELLLSGKTDEANSLLALDADRSRKRCEAYLEKRFPRFPTFPNL